MFELNEEISLDELRSQGFHPVRKMADKRFPENTWRYDSSKVNEGYIVVERKDRKVILKGHFNLETGEYREAKDEYG